MNDNLSLADQLKSALEGATILDREELRNKRQLTYFGRPDAHKWTSAPNDYEASLDACEGGNFDLGARLAEKAVRSRLAASRMV